MKPYVIGVLRSMKKQRDSIPSRSLKNMEYLDFWAKSSSTTNSRFPLELRALTMPIQPSRRKERNHRILLCCEFGSLASLRTLGYVCQRPIGDRGTIAARDPQTIDRRPTSTFWNLGFDTCMNQDSYQPLPVSTTSHTN